MRLIGPKLLAGLLCGWAFMAAGQGRDPGKLQIMNAGYPRAFFFRSCESGPSRADADYGDWSASYSRLTGIIGKCLDEEVLGRQKNNPEFFGRFKQDHPAQVVLLHLNGNARDPRFEAAPYFAGHWLYREPATVAADITAGTGETDIRVSDTKLFRVNTGRYQSSNDDVALFRLKADGTYDWDACEQVQLLAIDPKAGTIRVRRGQYETTPLAFPAGSRAVAHQVEGPWGKTNNIMWYYNYSTTCPRDKEGKTAADRFVDDIARWFAPGGTLAAFDGLEFDVLHNETRGDSNGDGIVDNGVIDGVNQYSIGVYNFIAALRQRMGDGFILQADGALGLGGIRSQRCWGLLNGIESEGWPRLDDPQIDDWSGGLNRHNYWQLHARKPVFNYINHKFVETKPGGTPGEKMNADIGFNIHRLAFAGACFTDSMICYAYLPPPGADGTPGIWDEFRAGTENRLGWLGMPRGPAVHLAAQSPDLLNAAGRGLALAAAIRGRVVAKAAEGGVEILPQDPGGSELTFILKGIETAGADLTALVTMHGRPRTGYPENMARVAQLELAAGKRGNGRNQHMTWLGTDDFQSVFHYRDAGSGTVDLIFHIEGAEAVTIRSVTVHSQADVMYREFDNGLVLANPGSMPFTFDLESLLPGQSWARFKATARQDGATNTGAVIGSRVTLGPQDALFLLRQR